MMYLFNYSSKKKALKSVFNEFTYSHIPIEKDGIYWVVSQKMMSLFENENALNDYEYSLETFVRETDNWLDEENLSLKTILT